MSAKKSWSYKLSLAAVVFGLVVISSVLIIGQPALRTASRHHVGIVDDWSHHHLVFSNPGTYEQAMARGTYPHWIRMQYDTRYILQQMKRNGTSAGGYSPRAELTPLVPPRIGQLPRRPVRNPLMTERRDWSVSLGGGSVAAGMYPAKYTFDVNATPDCTNDFVVFPVNIAGSGTQANLVGLGNLYSAATGTNFCSGTGPSFKFAYNVGTGVVKTSPALSLDGKKVAFVASITGGSVFHVLTIGTTGGNGTAATSPAVPSTGNNAVDTKITLSGNVAVTNSSPFVDYSNDVAYVGDDAGVLHKFTGVFNGTPAEVSTSPWPVTVNTGHPLTGPVYDPSSGNIFVLASGGNGGNRLYRVAAVAGTVVAWGPVTPNNGLFDPPLVDSAAAKLYVFVNADNVPGGGGAAGVYQFSTSFLATDTRVEQLLGNGLITNPIYAGAFDNAYFISSAASPTGNLYVCGRAAASQIPTLYRVPITGNVLGAPVTGPALTTGATNCSPVTEILNGATDRVFLGVTANGNRTGCAGACVYSFTVTGSALPANADAGLAATGGSSGIVIDNVSASAQASSIYYGPLTGNTAVKVTQSGLN